MSNRILPWLVIAGLAATTVAAEIGMPKSDPLGWPAITRDNMPGTRWWWMGSAVNPIDLRNELKTLRKAGLGTVEITPIYGVKGYENQFLEYLSPKWMDRLKITISEARKLDLNVDMVTGTGWCFGGPTVSDEDANASVVYKNGSVSQKPSGVKVKRPAPGGAGWMLNLLYPDAMSRYLQRFTAAFSKYDGPKPHGQFHDSYEYKSDWAPDFFEQFQKRRGYDLHTELPALFEGKSEADHVARVKCDYRETVSELIEESVARWTKWSHEQGSVSRNQAHGSPGNWLDIYAASDIPETEMFNKDRDILVSKFASSAAHVTGKTLVSAETGTWVAEHFTETLADLKYLFDDMFLSGVNRVVYHGTAYSPADAPWPGWCFYASTEMNSRNAIWHDVPALNTYAARVQSVLQNSHPDNDILLYWPIHDLWHSDKGTVRQLSVHAPDWFSGQSIGKTARMLWQHGCTFDYVSDKQLQNAKVDHRDLDLLGNKYRVVLVPACEHMPVETLKKLVALADAGATVIFENKAPQDVPGVGNLASRREEFRKIASKVSGITPTEQLETALNKAGVRSEASLVGNAGVYFVRRAVDGGSLYFIANRGTQRMDQMVKFSRPAAHTAILDPMSGRIGLAETRNSDDGAQVYLQLEPGESVLLRTFENITANAARWNYCRPTGEPIALHGRWDVKFIEGGPVLPKETISEKLGSWTDAGGEEAQSFGGTALYTLRFDAPASAANAQAQHWSLDLGKVCQSARVRLNGNDLGTVFIPPFRVPVDQLHLKNNLLEVEVTSTSANRIRDLDRRGVKWKIFYDINIVDLKYKPFDASKWRVAESGLIGPVTLRCAAVQTETSIADAGAIGDGKTLNTKAIQSAIDRMSASGGTIVVPKGEFLTGAIFLKPGVNLRLAEGAMLKGSTDIRDYPKIRTRIEGHFEEWLPALINADQADHLRISGPGTLDGNGAPFWKEFWDRRKADPKTANLDVPRPRLALIQNSEDVQISGVRFRNSGFWNLHLYRCKQVVVEKSRFEVPSDTKCPSTDGTDIDSCQSVTVRDCVYSVDDDCVCLKGSKGPFARQDKDSPPVEHILVTGCTFERGHGVVTLGSEATIVRDVVVENCTVSGPIALARLKLRPDTAQIYEDIHYRGITLKGTGGVIFQIEPWKQYFDLKGQPAPWSAVHNVTVSGIKGSYGSFGTIVGNPTTEIGGITMEDIDVTLKHDRLKLGNVKNITAKNVTVNGKLFSLEQSKEPPKPSL